MPASSLYIIKTQPKLGPVFISHFARGMKSVYVIPVYQALPSQEVACRKKGITNMIIHPLVKKTSLIKIPPDKTTTQLLKDWKKQMDEHNRYPGLASSRDKITMSALYKK